jgi:RimJ/RimL family protein N-acetyltransferase
VSQSTAFPADVPLLRGALVLLEPLGAEHGADLAVAAEEDRGSYGFTTVPRAGEIGDYLAERLHEAKNGQLVPFAQVRRADRRAVGVTCFRQPRCWADRPGQLCAVEVGGTWLAASAQRTGINPEAKFLLLRYAFETLKVARVDLMTDARNERSRRAIAGLGATFEGVLRSWSPSRVRGEDGLLRDSAVFSVTAAEWPAVGTALRGRVRASGGSGPVRSG